MISLDKKTGDLNIDGSFFPRQIKPTESKEKYVYDSLDKKALSADNSPCDFRAYYKNGKLTNINLNLDIKFISQNYKPPTELDFRDYLTPFTDFCIAETEKLLKTLIIGNKKKQSWGKMTIMTDPRDNYTFIEIKYY